jgi:hypothetical protein
MDNLFDTKIVDADSLFDDYFLNARMIYLHRFQKMPDSIFIGGIDAEKALEAMLAKFSDRIVRIYRYQNFATRDKPLTLNRAVALLADGVIEFEGSYCEIWHDARQSEGFNEIIPLLASFKQRARRQPREINIVVQGKQGLHLKAMEIKRTKLDLDLYYNEDFEMVDQLIRRRLGKKQDKGIVLLHGLPGTGKTTYLRYLIGKIKKRVLFLSPSVASSLMNPDFIELLINNRETVVVIEDAENVIMDRKRSPGSSVSNLLNISDGLLGKLSVARAQRLSRYLGFDTTVTRPMTLAEIANQHEKNQATERVEVLGFRRHQADRAHSLV